MNFDREEVADPVLRRESRGNAMTRRSDWDLFDAANPVICEDLYTDVGGIGLHGDIIGYHGSRVHCTSSKVARAFRKRKYQLDLAACRMHDTSRGSNNIRQDGGL